METIVSILISVLDVDYIIKILMNYFLNMYKID